ncbi:MAG: alpha/beta hydrolase [Burkholderiales bacterium]|uniref:alpha/beta hydrolase n=1 Tax=Inhella sp. TaxID=1921806 RepID=UPI001AD251DC|nr:alpha/beta hydrolase [Burkholderiales bacterium]
MRRRPLLNTLFLYPALAAAQRPPSVADASRLIVTEPLPMPGLERSRRLRIYLPPDYAGQPERRYPVIYFHDGQNVFDDATSYAGEWGADELLDRLARQQGLHVIAVAVDNGGERRMTELNPWDHERFGKGEGFAYLRFLVERVKPYVDLRWRTRPEASSTAIVGSSMGGLISFAALHRHREVFGLGGVLSPAFWVAPQQAQTLAESEPLLAHQRVCVYAGGRESRDMVPQARRMAELLRRQSDGVRFIEEPAAEHREAAWRAVLPRVLAHLFND